MWPMTYESTPATAPPKEFPAYHTPIRLGISSLVYLLRIPESVFWFHISEAQIKVSREHLKTGATGRFRSNSSTPLETTRKNECYSENLTYHIDVIYKNAGEIVASRAPVKNLATSN